MKCEYLNLCSGATVNGDDNELDVLTNVIYIFTLTHFEFCPPFRVFQKAFTNSLLTTGEHEIAAYSTMLLGVKTKLSILGSALYARPR